jgi:pimeloyl-ACP methyl ester carboxylesterase
MGNAIAFEPSRPRIRPSELKTHTLRTRRGDIVPAYFSGNIDNRPVLLFCHGNSDDLDHVIEHVGSALAHRLNVALYVFEYPGYSGTRGPNYEPSEQATYSAAEAAYDDAVERLKYDRRNIILYGKSLGTAVATYLAWQRPGTGALILVSALESLFRVAFDTTNSLAGDVMRTIDMIGRQPSPTQLIHGRSDDLVVARHAVRLQGELLRRKGSSRTFPICWIDGAGHLFEETYREDGIMTRDFDTMVGCLQKGIMCLFDEM